MQSPKTSTTKFQFDSYILSPFIFGKRQFIYFSRLIADFNFDFVIFA